MTLLYPSTQRAWLMNPFEGSILASSYVREKFDSISPGDLAGVSMTIAHALGMTPAFS